MPRLEQALGVAAYGLATITITLVMAAAAGLVIWRAHGLQLLSVQTASMVPTFQPGDALLVVPAQPSALKPGEVISYRSPHGGGVIVSHRLIAIDAKTGLLTTAGDAIHSHDPPFPPRLVIGRATAVAPGLGRVIDALRHPLGLALAVYLPATLIVATEVRRLGHSYRQPIYRLLD